MAVAVRINENLEIVVMKNHRVPFRQRRPNFILLHFGSHVEILVIPQHFRPRPFPWLGPQVAFDVDEVVGPCGGIPERLIDPPVQDERPGDGPFADIRFRGELDHRFRHFAEIHYRSLSFPD
ncbi:hypothetical protein D3C81_1247000 [compost metagenome]